MHPMLLILAFAVAQQPSAAKPTARPAETVVTKGIKSGTKLPIPTYRMVMVDGDVFLIRKFASEGGSWDVKELHGATASFPVESVASITELSEEELTEAMKTAPRGGPQVERGAVAARTIARNAARTSARTTARSTSVDPLTEPGDSAEPEGVAFREEQGSPRESGYSPFGSSTAKNYRLDAPAPYVSRALPGTTATGLPLHVGPRGGVYHMSKNGNKVYQKRK